MYPPDNFLHKSLQLLAGAVRHLLDLLVGSLKSSVHDSHICDAGDAHDPHAHVLERNALAARAHVDCIRAEHRVHFDLVRRLISGTGDLQVDAVCQLDAEIVSCFVKEFLKILVIDGTHVGEAHAQP